MLSTVPSPHSFTRYLLSILYVLHGMLSILPWKIIRKWKVQLLLAKGTMPPLPASPTANYVPFDSGT